MVSAGRSLKAVGLASVSSDRVNVTDSGVNIVVSYDDLTGPTSEGPDCVGNCVTLCVDGCVGGCNDGCTNTCGGTCKSSSKSDYLDIRISGSINAQDYTINTEKNIYTNKN